MHGMELLKAIAILGPILSLLALGCAIMLGSGVVGLGTGHEVRRLAGHLTQSALTMGACLLALALLQVLAGVRLGM